jgi:hypothetical protein
MAGQRVVVDDQVKMVAHNGVGIEINGKLPSEMKKAIFQPAFAVVVFFAAVFIIAAQPSSSHTAGDEVIVHRQFAVD